MALILYSALFYLLLPAFFLRLLWRSIREPAYISDLPQRFGFFRAAHPGELIWVHAVSAGETVAALPLIRRLVESGHPCLVTNMTPTGRALCRRLLHHLGDRVENCYAPYDLPSAVHRFIRRNRPVKLLIMETELWPNMLHGAWAAGIKTVLVNGRMSERSAARYRRLGFMTAPMMRSLDVLAVQTGRHAMRFVSLGAPEERVHVTGSIKFDAPQTDLGEKVETARRITCGRRLIVGASTHPGEEAALLAALPGLLRVAPDLVLVLAPRHTRRAGEVRRLAADHGFAARSHTEGKGLAPDEHLLFLDIMGEMQAYLVLAEVAFVGGSLVPVGGHNLLEAVRGRAAVVMGKHLHNIDDIVAQFTQADAMCIAEDEESLGTQLEYLLTNERRRLEITTRASQVMNDNRGAIDRVVALI